MVMPHPLASSAHHQSKLPKLFNGPSRRSNKDPASAGSVETVDRRFGGGLTRDLCQVNTWTTDPSWQHLFRGRLVLEVSAMFTICNLGGVALFLFRYDLSVADADVRWQRDTY